MSVPGWIEQPFHWSVDHFFKHWPQPVPEISKIEACKIISHRGERDNRTVFENTFSAFDPILEAGLWGIELDIRWTRDLCPVVFHDTDGRRLFGSSHVISQMTMPEVRQQFPVIPTLEALIQRYGKKLHLMVELKQEHYPEPEKQSDILRQLFQNLTPAVDFHLITLHPEMFQYTTFVPRSSLLSVAEINLPTLSHDALQKNYGGITGHYALMTNRFVNRHRQAGQQVGTGFIESLNALFREINRGVDWIFSNQALCLHQLKTRFLEERK
ncbi:MAG: glycerophosphodiester phosphodiesterase [SAR324 cluster bacterium]|nr:glycerophosphodiester phosphodiesterase [SAR324 cluster bacterium]